MKRDGKREVIWAEGQQGGLKMGFIVEEGLFSLNIVHSPFIEFKYPSEG